MNCETQSVQSIEVINFDKADDFQRLNLKPRDI
jgi:hypothetical protein